MFRTITAFIQVLMMMLGLTVVMTPRMIHSISPNIRTFRTFLPLLIIMILRALHVDATMKVAIGLVDHGTTDRLPRIAEGNGKDALALCHLGHGIRQSNSEQGKSDGGGKPDCQKNRFHITHAYA